MEASARRPSEPPVEGSPSPVPREVADHLEAALDGAPYRLYLADGSGGLSVVLASTPDPDPGDAWDLGLGGSRFWNALEAGAPVSLAAVRPAAQAPAADVACHVVRIGSGASALGGLLLRSPGGRRALSASLERRLGSPELQAFLSLLLELARARGELQELRGFRQGVHAALPYGFLGVDPLGRVSYLGGRAEEILGVSESEAVGKDCARIFRPVGMETNPLLEGMKRGPRSLELFIARPRSGEIPVSLQMSPVEDVGGGRGVVAFFADLSEEHSLEEAQRQKDRLAVLGELSAGVAHEIRNPLTGIANCAQVLREDLDEDDRRQRFVRIVLDEVARLNRIVEGLLSYARPNRPDLRQADLEACLRRAVELTQDKLVEKGIRTQLRIRGRIPPLFIDASQVEQVLLNLIRNAEEAMPDGGELHLEAAVIRRLPYRRRGAGRRATDRVRRAGEPRRQRFVQIKIIDTGGGIPKEILPRIWNPFFTTRSRGTGLGLSLCQSIVREHGGFLTVQSVEGKGTTFLLDLPIERRQGERRKGAV